MFKYFPCRHDKRPLFEDWQELATSDQATIESWVKQYGNEIGMWGIPTGQANGVLALDIDAKDGKNGFNVLNAKGVQCPTTMSQRTNSGGMHLLYQYPNDGHKYQNKVSILEKGSGIDVRGEGGYICVYGLDQSPLSPAPTWLTDSCRYTEQVLTESSHASVSQSVALSELYEAVNNIKNAPEGERNHTLNAEAFKAARAVLGSDVTVDTAKTLLRQAALEIGLSKHETEATLNSAFKGGQAKPLTSPFGAPDTSLVPEVPKPKPWLPEPMHPMKLRDTSKLKRPQLFKDWSTRDIHITTADGGTGKSTLKLQEAVCLAAGLPFLTFPCLLPEGGKTLFITAEDSDDKLYSMIGQICTDMGIIDNTEIMNKVLKNIRVKKESDMVLISKGPDNFLTYNKVALQTIIDSHKEFAFDMIIFDPIASFWGSESNVNDMGSAVSKFMSALAKETNALVEMINHVGKVSSSSKDMTQFAGRGGTGLPSHSRVSRALRPVDDDEYFDLTGENLEEKESAVMCNVNKFSDGSPLLNKPFLLIRKGYVFRYKEIAKREAVNTKIATKDQDRIMDFIIKHREEGREITKKDIVAMFSIDDEKIPKNRIEQSLQSLVFLHKVKETEHPDATVKDRVYVLKEELES